MSRSPIPYGTVPIPRSPRTPGPLGNNDAADPDRRALRSGPTPGPLGVNDNSSPEYLFADRQRAGGLKVFSISAFVKFLSDTAQTHHTGSGLRYVSQALEQTGIGLSGYPGSLKQPEEFEHWIQINGFRRLTPTPNIDYSPQLGDIMIIQPPGTLKNDGTPGAGTKGFPGHIQAWCGKNWISDWNQTKQVNPYAPWPSKLYQDEGPPFAVYRYTRENSAKRAGQTHPVTLEREKRPALASFSPLVHTPAKTWIEIQLIDEESGLPRPYAAYKIKLTDGTIQVGSLDDRGRARFWEIDPGECEVSFPEIDSNEWRPA